MNRKYLPLILMLTAGSVTCIITFFKDYTLLEKLVALFVVMLVFFVLGTLLKETLDYFYAQNAKRLKEEGEVIEKGPEEPEPAASGQEDGTEEAEPDANR